MRSRFIVLAQPNVKVCLQLVERVVHLLAERHSIELVERSLVEAFADRALIPSSLRVTDDCPIAVGNGHDLPRLIGESVPGVAAVVDDVVEGFEDAVRKPVLAHELPDIFLAVELGCARWQWQERDVARNPEIFRAVPAGLIEDENGVRAGGDLRGDLLEMKLHGFAVAGRQHERGAPHRSRRNPACTPPHRPTPRPGPRRADTETGNGVISRSAAYWLG